MLPYTRLTAWFHEYWFSNSIQHATEQFSSIQVVTFSEIKSIGLVALKQRWWGDFLKICFVAMLQRC